MCYENQFRDLHVAAVKVQAYFRGKIEAASEEPEADAYSRLQLAVHEWLGNLAEHASFEAQASEVRIHILRREAQLRCQIWDNSAGFDLRRQQRERRQQQVAEQIQAPGGGGVGLLLIEACTEQVEYVRAKEEEESNRLTLTVAI